MDTTKIKRCASASACRSTSSTCSPSTCKRSSPTPEQIASDLIFSAADAGFLTERCLRRPFAKVGALIGLQMTFPPRGLRRTFNDLARAAKVEALVTKSISGHVTDRMREHYSTVHPVD